MDLSATAPTSHFAPLIYIQSRSEKLTAILKKRGEKMKIIFDSEQERENVAIELGESRLCPSDLGLKESCVRECTTCWEFALEREEVRKNGT